MSRKGKYIERENKLVVSRDWGRRRIAELPVMRTEVFEVMKML